jgi:orotate phosphoribosyltransferase
MVASEYKAQAKRILKECKAFVDGGHFVYSSGRHGDYYINKDALYMRPRLVDDIAFMMADVAMTSYGVNFDFIVSPTHGGSLLGQQISHCCCLESGRDIMFAYSDKHAVGGHRILRRGFGEALRGKIVLLVDDIVTTGNTLAQMGQAVIRAGGFVAGAVALCDRGKIRSVKVFPTDNEGLMTVNALDIQIVPLVEIDLQTFEADKCPLCKAGRPVNVDLGRGSELDPFK